MKTTLITGITAALLMLNATARADIVYNTTEWFSDRFSIDTGSGSLFNPEEISLDLGLGWYSKDRGTDGRWGFGSGVKYFFTTEIGVSLDSNIGFNGHAFVDFLHASFVYRYPIEEFHIAPYALAGAGYEFDPSGQLSGNFGGGLEYRLNHLTGVYFDASYNIVHNESNYWLLRGGLRVVF